METNKAYRVASIYDRFVTDLEDFYSNNYRAAYEYAQELMKKDKWIVSCLIYSNKGTAIVLKRKWIEK